jgi:hypothetical protein
MSNNPEKSNRLFHNNGNGTFSDVSDSSGANQVGDTFGVAYADYDQDGWLDLIIGNRDDRYYLFHNQLAAVSENVWLRVDLNGGEAMNRDALGSRIYLTTSNGETQLQEVKSGSSLGAGNETALHFGLGAYTAEQMQIRWANGATETLSVLPPNVTLSLSYPPMYAFGLGDGGVLVENAGTLLTVSQTISNSGNRPDAYHVSLDLPDGMALESTDPLTLIGDSAGIWQGVVQFPQGWEGSGTMTMTVSSVTDPTISETIVYEFVVEPFYQQFLPALMK